MAKIKLGTKIKDNITGFVGFLTARCEYINGCVQYEITPETLKDGVPQKEYWLDEQRVEIIKKEEKKAPETRVVHDVRTTFRRRVGGPANHPSNHKPPSLAGYENET